mmetsp:Transcript_10352/g.14362  ORF Transcript_10352/g.14362 Transcript_10352/m.14362 type:complete len:83 (-) Transcript_10352:135-383(-)
MWKRIYSENKLEAAFARNTWNGRTIRKYFSRANGKATYAGAYADESNDALKPDADAFPPLHVSTVLNAASATSLLLAPCTME